MSKFDVTLPSISALATRTDLNPDHFETEIFREKHLIKRGCPRLVQ